MHLVGFIIRIYHDAWSPERRIGKIILLNMYCSDQGSCQLHLLYSQRHILTKVLQALPRLPQLFL